MVSLGVLTVLEHPDQLKLLRENPGLTPRAVEELLRFLAVTDLSTARVAREPLTVGRVDIQPGEGSIPRPERPTATRPCSTGPTSSTSPAARATISPSATGGTCASAWMWPGPSWN